MEFDRKRFEVEVHRWIYTGQEKRRYEYALSSTPVFFDLGSYKGGWAEQMISRHGGTVHMFEILPSYIEYLKGNYKEPRFVVRDYGLSSETKTVETGLENQTDGFSVYENESEEKTVVSFKRMSDYL